MPVMRILPLLALLGVPATAAPVEIGAYTGLYAGIAQANATVGASEAIATRIDLTAEGIDFAGTSAAGPEETLAQTTGDFLEETDTQIAVNGGFFAPCCASVSEPKDIRGLTVTGGDLVSPIETEEPYNDSLLISEDNAVIIGTVLDQPAGVETALTGSNILLADGMNVAPEGTTGFAGPNPRTAAGIGAAGRFLYLVTIDGRREDSPGATLTETGDLLTELGAVDGLNLDGGGSTALVRESADGGSILLNQPSGGSQRFVVNNLGVYAAPIPVPAAGPLALIGVAALGAVARSRRSR